MKGTEASNKHLSSIYLYAKSSAKYSGHKDVEKSVVKEWRSENNSDYYVMCAEWKIRAKCHHSTVGETLHPAKLAGMGWDWSKFPEKVLELLGEQRRKMHLRKKESLNISYSRENNHSSVEPVSSSE